METTSARASGTPYARRVRAARRTRIAQTVAACVTVGILLSYAFVSITFVVPESPAKSWTTAAFAPYFSQRWNLFAPDLRKSNRALQVQVAWREDGELVRSEWVDVTDIEYAAARGIPFPSRISTSSVSAAQAYVVRYSALSDQQRERVRKSFIVAKADGTTGPIENLELIDQIDDLGNSRSAVVRFMRYDYMLTRFAAAFGTAYFGHEVERVRWRMHVEYPNDFSHRFDPVPQREASETTFGWRQPAVDPSPEVVAIFADVIERYADR